MPVTYKLPKKEIDSVIILNTPAAADAALALGVTTILDEAGAIALKLKMSDLLGRRREVFTAGTAHVVDVDTTAAVLVANTSYSLTIVSPNVVNPETDSVYQTRTYVVAVDATPTAAELQALFIAAVNADLEIGVTASSIAGDIVRLTADSALLGQMAVSTNSVGTTVADQTAYVAPVGTASEVQGYVLPSSTIVVAGGEYTRYTLLHRKAISHNAVSGLKVVKDVVTFVYALEVAADYAAFDTALVARIAGTSTAALYNGAPII